jgi:hypothetical protein
LVRGEFLTESLSLERSWSLKEFCDHLALIYEAQHKLVALIGITTHTLAYFLKAKRISVAHTSKKSQRFDTFAHRNFDLIVSRFRFHRDNLTSSVIRKFSWLVTTFESDRQADG